MAMGKQALQRQEGEGQEMGNVAALWKRNHVDRYLEEARTVRLNKKGPLREMG